MPQRDSPPDSGTGFVNRDTRRAVSRVAGNEELTAKATATKRLPRRPDLLCARWPRLHSHYHDPTKHAEPDRIAIFRSLTHSTHVILKRSWASAEGMLRWLSTEREV